MELFLLMEHPQRLRFEVALPEEKQKKKICTLCYSTGSIVQPNGVKVPCPKGCPGFYPPYR
jgi:hypothetical protein